MTTLTLKEAGSHTYSAEGFRTEAILNKASESKAFKKAGDSFDKWNWFRVRQALTEGFGLDITVATAFQTLMESLGLSVLEACAMGDENLQRYAQEKEISMEEKHIDFISIVCISIIFGRNEQVRTLLKKHNLKKAR
jgi:hypothetical protein